MRGNIATVTAPQIKILNLTVGTNLVILFTATNNWNHQPQYMPTLGATNWFALTVQANRLVNVVPRDERVAVNRCGQNNQRAEQGGEAEIIRKHPNLNRSRNRNPIFSDQD